MKTILTALFVLMTVCHGSEEVRIYIGTSTDKEWPHRYVMKVEGNKITMGVEQKIYGEDAWFSWGDDVKTTEVTNNFVRFTCPWGVIGKALQVGYTLKFDKIKDEGFEASLTEGHLKDNKTYLIRFTRTTKDKVLPTLFTKEEAQQAAPRNR